MSLWNRVHDRMTRTRTELRDYAITKEARRRGWTPDQVRKEVEAAGGKRDRGVAHRTDVQPTEDGLAFWHADRDQYSPGYRRYMTGEPVPRHVAENRAPTQAEIWRQQVAPGGIGRQVGDRRFEPSLADKLTYAGRWAQRQDYRMHPCGAWVATGPKAEHEHHDCREMPGYIEAMREDALKQNDRRGADTLARGDQALEQMLAAADRVLAERDAQLPDLEAG